MKDGGESVPYLSSMSDLLSADKRVALVTGANKGIGLEVARQLGRYQVIKVLIVALK